MKNLLLSRTMFIYSSTPAVLSSSTYTNKSLKQECQTRVVTAVSRDVSGLPPPFAKPGVGVGVRNISGPLAMSLTALVLRVGENVSIQDLLKNQGEMCQFRIRTVERGRIWFIPVVRIKILAKVDSVGSVSVFLIIHFSPESEVAMTQICLVYKSHLFKVCTALLVCMWSLNIFIYLLFNLIGTVIENWQQFPS